DTAARILAEIDRLDAIARAFSRFASPQAEQLPLEPVDLFAAAREVVQLYALGGTEAPTRFEMAGEAGTPALARRDEVKEVLVNLLENARNAGARRVTVRVSESGRRLAVEDDGRGIPADALPRVFEPAFSTTSSGAGLGLDQGSLRRYNAAYRAVPGRAGQRGRPKLTIPIPLGLIQFFHDHPLSNIKNDPAFNHDSAGFNPVELLNTFLNPPLFLEVKKAPTPTNDVVF